LKDIENSWQELLKKIGFKNSKTESFLSDVNFDSFVDNILVLKVNNVSQFIFKSLINDLSLIEASCFELFNNNIKEEI
jgi:hypothetical protein